MLPKDVENGEGRVREEGTAVGAKEGETGTDTVRVCRAGISFISFKGGG